MKSLIRRLVCLAACVLFWVPESVSASDWKAGIARAVITPEQPLWLAGYAARTRPAQGRLQDLYAKVLVLEDEAGSRLVLVTTDMLGFPAPLAARVAQRVEQRFGVTRDRLLLNASHTHSGPVVRHDLEIAYNLDEAAWRAVEEYTTELEERLVNVVGAALENLRPARVTMGRTRAGFAVNRRVRTEGGYQIGVNRQGPVDHEVPFLVVDGPPNSTLAIVFGYACHNTTGTDQNYYFHGDYAGSAQAWLEQRYPGTLAFFVTGCGADANPYPRGNVQLAEEHGQTLAKAVDSSLTGPLRPVRGPAKSSFALVPLAFSEAPGRQELESKLQDENLYIRRHSEAMLKLLDANGRLPEGYPYPVQVWQFGEDLTLIALAGEVVVDYALRLKEELGAENIWVAGYSNDVFAYIPSRRILEEGGYEAAGSMIYYGQPGPFTPAVEETIIEKVHELVRQVRKH